MAILGTLLGELSYNNWNLLVAARLVAGFCISAYESILVAAIGFAPFLESPDFVGTCFLSISEAGVFPPPTLPSMLHLNCT
jgi:hypothetical protein